MGGKVTHAPFKRGLCQDFVDQLNEMYNESGSWWRRFVDDEDLFLAIRNNYINVYYRGNNLLKLEQRGRGRNRTIGGQIHYKYLLKPSVDKSAYVKIIDGKPCLQDTKSLFFESLDVKKLKAAADHHAGREKTGVYEIICANRNILDTEVGFSTPRSYVDFAALIEAEQGVKIVFFEAKHFTNQELRTSGDADPKVIDQIERYKCLLKKNRHALIDSYRKVCCNLLCTQGLAKKYPKRHKILKSIADGAKLCIDENPRLVVFGYDCDQESGKVRAKLEKNLKGRAFFERDSKGFTRGISTKG